jgi:hypothetical protein
MLGWDIVLGMGLGSDLNDKTVVRLLHPFICTTPLTLFLTVCHCVCTEGLG